MFQGLFGKSGGNARNTSPHSRQRQRSSLTRNDIDFNIENPDDEDLQKLMVESEEFMKEVCNVSCLSIIYFSFIDIRLHSNALLCFHIMHSFASV